MLDIKNVPENLGIIMDGNGRWAVEKGLPRKNGHTKGMENILNLLDYVYDLGTKNVVCYALSTENLSRDKEEVDHILSLIFKYFDAFIEVCLQKEVCVKFVGNIEVFSLEVQNSLKKTEKLLSPFENKGKTLYLALAYGGRDEIISAVNEAVRKGKTVTEEEFLTTLQFPFSLDLIIRTGGDHRLSNFFLYQASYAELYFLDKYFPDFNKEDLFKIYEWYQNRNRKFGLVNY